MTGFMAELTYPSQVVSRKSVIVGMRASLPVFRATAVRMLQVKNGIQHRRNTPGYKIF